MFGFKSKSPSALLGISLDGRRLEVALVRGRNGSASIEKTAGTELSLDPLTQEPELVGREIRDFLDESNFSETRCSVVLPNHWTLSFQFEMPELSEDDAESYIQMRSEQEFPFSVEDLIYSISKEEAPSGGFLVFVAAMQRNHVVRIEQVLASAGLRPLSFSIECCPLLKQISSEEEAVILLKESGSRIDLVISRGTSPFVLRSIGEIGVSEEKTSGLDMDALIREIKITLGQLPEDLRSSIQKVHWVGSEDAELEPPHFPGLDERLRDLGLTLKIIQLEEDAGIGSAKSCLEGVPPQLEFLPPRVSRFQEFTIRVSTRKNLWLGGSVAATVFIALAAIAIQDRILNRLDGKWSGMEKNVGEIQELQDRIRFYRPWFDPTVRSLIIARQLTEAFPEDGAVWVRQLEIKDQSRVFCSGVTRDNQSLLSVLDTLRNSPGVQDLRVQQIRGKEQLQFAFNYQWNEDRNEESR
ncbi:MAG TPA: hypothetical protein EYQ50_19765 [Verrucomicrobiales bacterium]|nr:hypothetical protein [Verrucomicrobiales bacterium]HIL69107.1 hypothetical protein [Verrucomicrobiota bacterium]